MQMPPEEFGSELAVIEPDPKRPWKAIAAAVGGFAAGFIAYWIADVDPFTAKDVGEAVLAGLAASVGTGGLTYATKNPLRTRVLDRSP